MGTRWPPIELGDDEVPVAVAVLAVHGDGLEAVAGCPVEVVVVVLHAGGTGAEATTDYSAMEPRGLR
jgi:hypothetical protein